MWLSGYSHRTHPDFFPSLVNWSVTIVTIRKSEEMMVAFLEFVLLKKRMIKCGAWQAECVPGSRNAGLHVSILLVVQQPDPNQPKPEGSQMVVLRGEPLAEGSWPPSLLAALQQWGTTQPRAPCLTALDTAGKAVYTLTYGKCQQEAEGPHRCELARRGRAHSWWAHTVAGKTALPHRPTCYPSHQRRPPPVLHVWVCLSDQWSSLLFHFELCKNGIKQCLVFFVWHFLVPFSFWC